MKEKKRINKKQMFLIGGGILLIILVVGVLVFTLDHNKEENRNNPSQEGPTETLNKEMPKDSSSLLETYKELEVTSVSLNKIEFGKNFEGKAGDKVTVYVYSTPKFVGEFEIQEIEETKYIEGLEEKLKVLNLSDETHYLAILIENQVLGYVKLEINIETNEEIAEEPSEEITENEKPTENTTERTTETKVVTEDISYTTEEVKEVNMKRGERKVVTSGVTGKKEVSYQITYEDGKEISREKISEKVLQNAVSEIVKVGVSDYNLNTDTYVDYAGPVCTELDENNPICKKDSDFMFEAISINGKIYITCIDKQCTKDNVFLEASWYQNSALLEANYNGKMTYFFTERSSDKRSLTLDICQKYNLACGSW